MGNMQSQAQYVLRTVEERGVRFVQLWFTDVLGRHKAFHVTPAELEDALAEGMTFDPYDGMQPKQLLTKTVQFSPAADYDVPANYPQQFRKLWKLP